MKKTKLAAKEPFTSTILLGERKMTDADKKAISEAIAKHRAPRTRKKAA